MNSQVKSAEHVSIHPATSMGVVALTVADLGRSLWFYTQAIGLIQLQSQPGDIVLGVSGRPLLRLIERPGAQPWTELATGLYHFALLLPTRADLGRWILNWQSLGLPEVGQGDHYVSEALYLNDPDGHGIEIYRDRPRSEWTWKNGSVVMGTGPVDIAGVVREAEKEGLTWGGMPAGTTMGHVHLQVGDVEAARAFYVDTLSFDLVAPWTGALFVSAGGYHHHFGLNTWHSRGSGPAPDNVAKLKYVTVTLPNQDALDAVIARIEAARIPIVGGDDGAVIVHDPWQTEIRLTVAGA